MHTPLLLKYFNKIILTLIFALIAMLSYGSSSRSELMNHAYKIVNTNPDEAINIAQIHINTITSSQEKFDSYYIFIKAYKNKGLYDQSLKYVFESQQKKIDFTNEQKFLFEIEKADLLRIVGLVDYSNIFIKKAEELIESDNSLKNNEDLHIELLIEKLVLNIELEKYLDANENYNQLITNYKDYIAKKPEVLNIINTYYVSLLTNNGKINEAISLINNIIEFYKWNEPKHPYYKMLSYKQLAFVKIQLNDFSNAEIALNEAIEIVKKYKNPKLLADLYQRLGNIYLASNNVSEFKKVYEANKNYGKDLFLIESDSHNMVYNMMQLDSDNRLLDLSEEKKSKTIYIVVFLIIITVIVLILFIKQYTSYNYYIKLQKYVEFNKRLQSEQITFVNSNVKDNLEKEVGDLHSDSELLDTVGFDNLEIKSDIIAEDSIDVKNQVVVKTSLMSKELEEELLARLKKFEKTNKFLSKDISLGLLASYIDTNTKYLSEIIKKNYNCNYNSYINNLRINYIIAKLRNDPKLMTYKISYLAEISGFSSHSSFATVFKQITGNSPAVFIEFLKKEKSQANENSI